MSRLREFVREIHRRSMWQVLAIYLAGSWVAFEVVGEVTEAAALPDWVPGFALVLLILGLPVVLATAFVQEGVEAFQGNDAGRASGGVAAPGTETASGAETSPEAEVDSGRETPGAPHATSATAAAPRGRADGLLTWRTATMGGLGAGCTGTRGPSRTDRLARAAVAASTAGASTCTRNSP